MKDIETNKTKCIERIFEEIDFVKKGYVPENRLNERIIIWLELLQKEAFKLAVEEIVIRSGYAIGKDELKQMYNDFKNDNEL